MKNTLARDSIALFALFCILFIPFPFAITGLQQRAIESLLGHRIHSDSRWMYRLLLYISIAAILMAAILQFISFWKEKRHKLLSFIYSLSCYYLSLMLMKYGLDKIFLHQFYLPEPNSLFTPLGQMERGLLYWSSMGTSPVYSIFMGSIEVLTAVLLLFKRTRLFALLLSLGILVNIVAVNFGFDISVKLYSLFLLFLCIYLLFPFFPVIYYFFFKPQQAFSRPEPGLKGRKFTGMFLKWLAICFILLESLYPYIRSGNFNDSIAGRPYLHGAYEVKDAISPVKRFFIHRKGYIIFQDRNDTMKDFKLSVSDSTLILTDYKMNITYVPFKYDAKDSVLILHYPVGDQSYDLTGKAINWRKLPAMQKGVHWISE